jgi:CheY-like chemotaxis protein
VASILIVEDDAFLRMVIAEQLQSVGWAVRSAADGADALGVLRRWLPNVILLDIVMPRMDGPTFHAEMARRERTATIPIVLMSGGERVHHQATALGAVASLAKPFEFDALITCLESVIGR